MDENKPTLFTKHSNFSKKPLIHIGCVLFYSFNLAICYNNSYEENVLDKDQSVLERP